MKLKFYTKFLYKRLSFNLSLIKLISLPITICLIKPSNEFFIIGFIFFIPCSSILFLLSLDKIIGYERVFLFLYCFFLFYLSSVYFSIPGNLFLTLKDYFWPSKIGHFSCFTVYFLSIFLFLLSNFFETFWKQKILYSRNLYSKFEIFCPSDILFLYIREIFLKNIWKQYCF